MFYLKRTVFLILFFGSVFATAQESKKRVLVIPFSRFDFQSQFSLERIAEVNQLKDESLVMDTLLHKFVSAISNANHQIALFSINEHDHRMVSARVGRQFKDSPTSHYGVNLELFSPEDRSQLLSNYSADYLLFITQYRIDKKVIIAARNFDGNRFIAWSIHNVDYELYDKKGNLIAIGDAVELPPRMPAEENYLTNGLVLASMTKGYSKLPKDLYNKILAYKGKTVYRLKNKRK